MLHCWLPNLCCGLTVIMVIRKPASWLTVQHYYWLWLRAGSSLANKWFFSGLTAVLSPSEWFTFVSCHVVCQSFFAFEILAAVFCECTWEMQGGTPEDFFYVQCRVQNERKMVKYYVPVFQQFYLNRWDRLSLKHRSRKMIFWINLSVNWGKHGLIVMCCCWNSSKETHDWCWSQQTEPEHFCETLWEKSTPCFMY